STCNTARRIISDGSRGRGSARDVCISDKELDCFVARAPKKKRRPKVLISIELGSEASPHPEERAFLARVSKDGRVAHGSRRRARARLLTMRFLYGYRVSLRRVDRPVLHSQCQGQVSAMP